MNKQKIGIVSLGTIIFGIVLYFANTGPLNLRSDILNVSGCTLESQQKNLAKYNNTLRSRDSVQSNSNVMSNEIFILNNTIAGQKTLIQEKTGQLNKNNLALQTINSFIDTNCKTPSRANASLCAQKKNEKKSVETTIRNLQNELNKINTSINRMLSDIVQKQEKIKNLQQKISELNEYINQYNACTEMLKNIPIISSPLMSGEVTLPGDTNKALELYKFSIQNTRSSKIVINQLSFDMAIGGNAEELSLNYWKIQESGKGQSEYDCRPENQKIICSLRNSASRPFEIEGGKTVNYSLIAMISRVKPPVTMKIYSLSKNGLTYNGSSSQSNNQTTPIKIIFAKPVPVCGNSKIEGSEQCDDGNKNNTDGCDNLCKKSNTPLICTDTDGGMILDKKGTASNSAKSATDVCTQEVCSGSSCQYNEVATCTEDRCFVDEAVCLTAGAEAGLVGKGGSGQADHKCPNGCSDGACRPAAPIDTCEDLAVTPETTTGGGTINYTCHATNDVLCVLDPTFCKPKTYSIVLKDPTGTIVQTLDTTNGSLTIPTTPIGSYTAECFINGQTTTINTCKKTITNQVPSLPVETSRQKNQDIEDLGFLYLEPNSAQLKIGSFVIKNPNTEAVRITELKVQFPSLAYNPGSLISVITSGSTVSIIPQETNVISVDFTVGANSEKVFDIFADTGIATQIPMGVSLSSVKSVGVSSAIVNTSINGSAYYEFKIQSTLMKAISAQYGPKQYIVPTGGASDSQVKYCFSTNGGYTNITELRWQVLGTDTIRTVRVGNTITTVSDGTARMTGLKIKISPNASSCIDLLISYNSVGTGGIASGATSSIDLTYIKYEAGSVVKENTKPSLSHLVSEMVLVGSKPIVSINTTPRNGLHNDQIKIGEITVTADNSGNIKINDIVYRVTTSGFTIPPTTIQTPRLQNNAGSTAFRCSANGGLTITCQFGTDSNEDSDGYVIPAGTSQIFSLFGTPEGANFDGVTGASLSTSLDQDGFNWDDGTSISGQGVKNFSGLLLYGFPIGSFTVTQ